LLLFITDSLARARLSSVVASGTKVIIEHRFPVPQENAEQAVREMLRRFSTERGLPEVGTVVAEDQMDDGTPIRLAVTINRRDGSAVFDFAGAPHFKSHERIGMQRPSVAGSKRFAVVTVGSPVGELPLSLRPALLRWLLCCTLSLAYKTTTCVVEVALREPAVVVYHSHGSPLAALHESTGLSMSRGPALRTVLSSGSAGSSFLGAGRLHDRAGGAGTSRPQSARSARRWFAAAIAVQAH